MTIDAAIAELTELRKTAKFGGNTCLAICLDESELPYVDVERFTNEVDQTGALVLVHGRLDTAS